MHTGRLVRRGTAGKAWTRTCEDVGHFFDEESGNSWEEGGKHQRWMKLFKSICSMVLISKQKRINKAITPINTPNQLMENYYSDVSMNWHEFYIYTAQMSMSIKYSQQKNYKPSHLTKTRSNLVKLHKKNTTRPKKNMYSLTFADMPQFTPLHKHSPVGRIMNKQRHACSFVNE